MGRDYFTYASKISVSPEQFDKLLTFLEFESDGDKSTRQNLIDALEEEHWLLKADSAGILSFEMSDADDTDFDWERFAELAYFLDEGSYYESEADSNQIQGAYVFGDSLEYRLSELDASAPHQISILSTRRAKLRDPGSSANRLVASAAPASPDAPIFADLDTSYWKTRDKEWKDNRQKQWQKIEVAATAAAPEKRLKNMIKAFFLRGKMPNRAAIEKLEIYGNPINLFKLLWLHPSEDSAVLSKLRDQYIYAQDTTYEDVMSGMAEFYLDQVKYTSIDFKPTRKIQWPFLQGKGGFYFEIMYGDVTDWDGRVSKPDKSGNRKPISFSYFCLCNVTTMAKWLTLSRPVPFNEEYLLAHEYPFHLWCQIASRNDWYGKDCLRPDYQMNIAWALDQIRQYSLTMDEDSYRGRFTAKLLQHFNEGSVDPDFRSLWNSVLSGQYALRKPHGW